jgi:hypothetical protein
MLDEIRRKVRREEEGEEDAQGNSAREVGERMKGGAVRLERSPCVSRESECEQELVQEAMSRGTGERVLSFETRRGLRRTVAEARVLRNEDHPAQSTGSVLF